MCLGYGGVRLGDSVTDLLINALFQLVKPFICVLEIFPIKLSHQSHLSLKLILQIFEVGFEPVPECFQSIVQAFRLCLREVAIGLDFALDVLEFGFELFF